MPVHVFSCISVFACMFLMVEITKKTLDHVPLEQAEKLTVQSVSKVFSETKDPSRPKRKMDV